MSEQTEADVLSGKCLVQQKRGGMSIEFLNIDRLNYKGVDSADAWKYAVAKKNKGCGSRRGCRQAGAADVADWPGARRP
jgi:hypothetical protein